MAEDLKLWNNNVPIHLRQTDIGYKQFKLNTLLFGREIVAHCDYGTSINLLLSKRSYLLS